MPLSYQSYRLSNTIIDPAEFPTLYTDDRAGEGVEIDKSKL